MVIIIMIACCYVGALGPKAELILVCAAKPDIHEAPGTRRRSTLGGPLGGPVAKPS